MSIFSILGWTVAGSAHAGAAYVMFRHTQSSYIVSQSLWYNDDDNEMYNTLRERTYMNGATLLCCFGSSMYYSGIRIFRPNDSAANNELTGYLPQTETICVAAIQKD